MTSTLKPRLIDDLNALHASYVSAINTAVADDDMATVHELAAGYDREATQMVAEREGKTHLLPLKRRAA
ncbi:hypothetical protein NPS01_17920 [Nocardioides psychrotolerans]|uniref:Uncharacterized protein n=1 Tax=Nocardioides psychrotolerans TaxID=1005945 RepID=A0A1I3ITX9_9ACTN|nr:hypothetical protein [Nocardioides psychrotolerans]GEP38129.1 hypothetical protein NPS01_17920 [Nocardioides psychrotolerans]SFI51300.1 hypothetical protein SAMN05216561_109141 [Nocardioides psychrotolerans]